MQTRVTNRGSGVWRASSRSSTGHVRLGIQLLDEEGRVRQRDYHRVPMPADVRPGGSVDLSFSCPAPDDPGEYQFKFDMVSEGITWFEAVGSPVVVRKVTVL